ncbi:MAG: phosphatase PAP2 family protein [Paludibacteraceae bacterium]|nr:phosphatase PAP2 family protein [Paludibacteraceae bacterium]
MNNKNLYYSTLPYLLLFAIMGVVALCFPQKDLHLYLNQYHTCFLDKLMLQLTYIAAYGIYVAILGLLIWRWRVAVALLIAHLTSTGITQVIKHIVGAPRPALVFDLANTPDALPVAEGVKMNLYNSFPSGHTTTVSTLCVFLTILALMYIQDANNIEKDACKREKIAHRWSKKEQLLIFSIVYLTLLLLCIGCGYSRIYLSQHFLLDVAVGGIIGTIVSLIVGTLTFRIENKTH